MYLNETLKSPIKVGYSHIWNFARSGNQYFFQNRGVEKTPVGTVTPIHSLLFMAGIFFSLSEIT